MEIELVERDSRGYALATEDGARAGLMTFWVPDAAFIIIQHTEVEPAFKGRSVGMTLLGKIAAMAREKQLKILPRCPFARAMFDKHEHLQDVLKT